MATKLDTKQLGSPKRKGDKHPSNGSAAFDYYAAFSHSFVVDLIDYLKPRATAILLDPWNGSGTTTTIAAEKGVQAVGLDLNPAMVAISNARLVSRTLARTTIDRVKRRSLFKGSPQLHALPDDGLLTWLNPRSVGAFRHVQRYFQEISDETTLEFLPEQYRHIQRKRLNLFLNLSLCSALRSVISSFETSNPTWIPHSLPVLERVRPKPETIESALRAFLDIAFDTLASCSNDQLANVTIGEADSRALPLPSHSVSTVIGSPPYCTRIDYAVATSPELFLLRAVTASTFRELRDRLLGTTSISLRRTFEPPREWGRCCLNTIRQISRHPSKASDTYYLKTFLQYFSGLSDSLRELDRVTTSDGAIALVIQDSYYKNIHVNLPLIVTEMAQRMHWYLDKKQDYTVRSTLAASNPKVRSYRDDFTAIESVLIFRKASRSIRRSRRK